MAQNSVVTQPCTVFNRSRHVLRLWDGARLLATLNWIVDVVYLDSAHEIGETFADLSLYFQLIRKGGVLIGDDYIDFPAVKHDVNLFVHYKSKFLKFEIIDSQQWGIIKLA